MLAALAVLAGLAGPVAAQEMRLAIITVYEDINDTTSIQNWVNALAALKYNSVAIHCRYRGDATYFPNKTNSTYPNPEPRTSAAGSIDVLQEFTTRGQAAGLKVFAYVNLFLVTDGSNTDPRATHPVNTHPEWITYARTNSGTPYKMTVTDDPEGIWLDPGIAAVRTYTHNICADIMANYNCDGIILDRVRYPQTNWNRTKDFGYNPTAVAAFNAANGTSGTPAVTSTTWQAWRRQQVTATVQQIYNTVIAMDPNHIVLALPIGRLNDAVNFNYQDWPTWMNNGYLDAVFPQIYRDTLAEFNTIADEHLAAYTGPRLFGCIVKAYNSGIAVQDELVSARTKGFDGTGVYRHANCATFGYTDDVQNAYATAASWPAMPWKVPTEYIVDNGAAGWSASANWYTATSTPGFYGTNYHVRPTASVSDQASWSVNLPTSGSYDVFVRYTAGSNRPTAASYSVVHAGGTATVSVNQTINGGTWVKLGTWNMNAGNSQRVRLSCWTTLGKYVIADAVRLVKK